MMREKTSTYHKGITSRRETHKKRDARERGGPEYNHMTEDIDGECAKLKI